MNFTLHCLTHRLLAPPTTTHTVRTRGMAVATGGGNLQTAALPLYVQRLGQLLNISPLLDHIEKVFAGSDDENFKRCVVVHVLHSLHVLAS